MGAWVDPRLYEIMDMAKAAGCVLATGHFARDEVRVILDYAKRIGLEKIVITHPNYQVLEFTLEDCRRFVAEGAHCPPASASCTTRRRPRGCASSSRPCARRGSATASRP